LSKRKNRKQENNNLEYFNELIQNLSNKEIEIYKNYEQIIVLENQAINEYEKGEILRKDAKELISQIKSWLKEYGEENDLNYKGDKCVEIEEKVKDIQKSIERAEERSLDASNKALRKLEKAKRLTDEYNLLKEEYMQVIYGNDEEQDVESEIDEEEVVENKIDKEEVHEEDIVENEIDKEEVHEEDIVENNMDKEEIVEDDLIEGE